MQRQSSFHKNTISAEFLTQVYRISGDVNIGTEPVLDQLNDHLALFIEVEHMFLSRLNDPAQLTESSSTGQVRKDNTLIVVLNKLEHGLPRRQGQYSGRDHRDRPLLVITNSFEVRGSLRLHPSVKFDDFLRTTPEQFVPLFNARATYVANPDVVFEGGALLVNRAQFEAFSLLDR